MNGDLISRSSLWKRFDKPGLLHDREDRDVVQDIIESAPSVDAVQVVRCGECKRNPDKDNWCNAFTMLVSENDFCCWGVKDNG